MSVTCPLECITYNGDDFIQKNETFILTCVASFSALVGVLLSYCIRSRCTKISCCGLICDRDPIPVNHSSIEEESPTLESPAPAPSTASASSTASPGGPKLFFIFIICNNIFLS